MTSKKQTMQHAKAWEDMQKLWREQTEADMPLYIDLPHAAAARDMFVLSADRAEFNDMLTLTGVGNHPAFISFMRNVYHGLFREMLPNLRRRQPPVPVKHKKPRQ